MAKQQINSTGGRQISTLATDKRTNIRQNLNRHKERLVGSKTSVVKHHKCADCPKTFAYPSQLEQHKRCHTGKRPFECQQCKKRFYTFDNLKKHLRIHSGERPFKCAICARQFNHSSNFKRHSLIHSDERPFKCAICARQFNQSNNLKKHLRIHSGERPFKCAHCGRAFSQSGALKNHSRRIHSKDEELPKEKYIKVVIVRHVTTVRRETMFVRCR